jgi:hypothetical protein
MKRIVLGHKKKQQRTLYGVGVARRLRDVARAPRTTRSVDVSVPLRQALQPTTSDPSTPEGCREFAYACAYQPVVKVSPPPAGLWSR